MADENNTTTESAEGKAPKVKTVAEDMQARRVFPNIDEAAAYLSATADTIPDFSEQAIAAPGMDAEGSFDPAIYTPETAVMVSLLRNKQKVKAIVVAPIPTLDQLLANEAGRGWVDRIILKELNHVAVRQLREAEDVSTVVDQMPTNLEAYITSSREGGGGIMESFDELYKLINATLAAKLPVWAKARFIKSELKKALESRGYAAEYYPALEDYKGNSLFVTALELGINAAKRKGLDPTIFERWQQTRDAKAFDDTSEDEDSFDLDNIDALADALIESDKPDAEGEAQPDAEAGAAAESEEAPATA